MRRLAVPMMAVLLASAACARSEDVPEDALENFDTSDPAALPEAEPALETPAAAAAPVPATWQAAERGEGTTLRLVTENDDLVMSLACANVPREIVATVPGFVRSTSDSRFSLALGSAPIILVADVATTVEGQGVVARAPVPGNFAAQLGAATEISALYGAGNLGPYAAPDAKMVRGLLNACGIAVAAPPEPATAPGPVTAPATE